MSRTTTERRTLDQDEPVRHGTRHDEVEAEEVNKQPEAISTTKLSDMSQYHPHTPAVIEAVAGVTFPATPASLIEAARNNMAPDSIIQRLGNLSAELYPNLDSVTESIGL